MNDNYFFLWIIFFIVMYALLSGCVTSPVPDNPCSMANMTASELEHALEHGCGH